MLRITLWLFMGVLVLDFVSCSVLCPDRSICPDQNTCCQAKHGYGCCPYPDAQCCTDLAHCCPSGFRCNLVAKRCEKENQPWMNMPMVNTEVTEEPVAPVLSGSSLKLEANEATFHETPMTALTEAVGSTPKTGVIRCNSAFYCPAATTCCKGSTGQWNCCPYPLGTCCADGQHCCQFGYTCDPSSLSCRRPYSQVPAGAQQHAQTD